MKIYSFRAKTMIAGDWERLSKDSAGLRIWQKGQVVSAAERYFDDFMLQTARKLYQERPAKTWMSAARLIGAVIGHPEQKISDAFLAY